MFHNQHFLFFTASTKEPVFMYVGCSMGDKYFQLLHLIFYARFVIASQSKVLEKLKAIQQVKFLRGKSARRNMFLYYIF
jgi:hypothetical protein